MPQRGDAWLRHQQQRWMRPDAARYLRPDAARFVKPGTDPAEVYPALEFKYPGQPRLPRGSDGPGRFTFGRAAGSGGDAGAASSDGADDGSIQLPEIVITAESEPLSTTDFWSSFWSGLDNLIGGVGDLLGSPEDNPPTIPRTRPSRSSQRTAVVRAILNWLARNVGIVADAYYGLQRTVDWLHDYQDVIQANRDPPRTLQELMDDVGKKRPGYDNHHIIEQTAAERWGLTPSEIHDPSNLVSIPRLKHYQITGWYAAKSDRFGGIAPREYLSKKAPEERLRIGLEALVMFEVPKP